MDITKNTFKIDSLSIAIHPTEIAIILSELEAENLQALLLFLLHLKRTDTGYAGTNLRNLYVITTGTAEDLSKKLEGVL